MSTWGRIYNGFDRRHGTETSGVIALGRLGIRHPAVKFGIRYQAIDPGVFRHVLQALRFEIDLGGFTFIDLGCGKGRALVLAREFEFKEIVGVELSPVLATCARGNLAKTDSRSTRVVCQDAGEFEFPPGDLVVYLFNPFRSQVFRRVIQNLCSSATGEVYIVYINPTEERLLREKQCFVPLRSSATFVIYRHLPHSAGATVDGLRD
jgi:SAM-dependent methyltransferase